MISLYSGTPGSGKSLHVASRIYHGLRFGRLTVCNFEIVTQYIKKKNSEKLPFVYLPNNELSPDRLIEISRKHFKYRAMKNGSKSVRVKEDDILLVIDECQIMFNSRNWQQSGRDKWLSFFSQHRKYGYEIVLVAQFDGMVDRQIRTLIEYEYIHRKANNFGWFGKVLTVLAFGNLFCSVKMWYPLNERIGSEFFKAHKRYYRIYDTFAFFDQTDDKKQKKKEALKLPS